MLLIPMSNINLAEKAENENRNLEKYEPFIKNNWQVNYEYGRDFELWFNDRFNGRDKSVKYYNLLKSKISDVNTKKVLIGKDGWLFYRGDVPGGMQCINDYQNTESIPLDKLKKYSAALNKFNNLCIQKKNNFIYSYHQISTESMENIIQVT
jgi:hypothetical protein